MDSKLLKNQLKLNWKSGLTVAFISIPLSLALAIASGATPVQGIITAFWAGLIGAFLGGSPFNIIGPTGALSGILISFAITNGSFALPIIAIVAGIIIFLFYIFKFDKYIIFIPRSVVQGFTLGVAFLIAFGQLDSILGVTGVAKTENMIDNIVATLSHFSKIRWAVFAIFIFSVLFIILWDKKIKKLPGSIIIAFIGIIAAIILDKTNSTFSLTILSDKFADIKPVFFENFYKEINPSIFFTKKIWSTAFAVSVIGILETLLSGQIAKQMTKVPFNRSKEVLGLSIANLGSGLMGGIPATAALARTALNIKSGATSRVSGIISALFLAIIVLFLLTFFKMLPMVIIGAILFVVAIRMSEVKHFIKLIYNKKAAFAITTTVAVITVIEDPITALLVGSFISLLIFVNHVSYGSTEVTLWKDGKLEETLLSPAVAKRETLTAELVVYKITGTLTYINMPAHIETVNKIINNKYVVISLRNAFYADNDGVEYLGELVEILKASNETVYLAGVNELILKAIENEPFYKIKLTENKIFERTSDAIKEVYGI
ncbi:MAG: inorganic anion transporter, sulfate permease (SulP) subfamily protein [Bacteroidetes bacterium]|nr:inorganic anion transporter, sulfate permease (SulP) subfamily protein [Bacteroidota bacterium]